MHCPSYQQESPIPRSSKKAAPEGVTPAKKPTKAAVVKPAAKAPKPAKSIAEKAVKVPTKKAAAPAKAKPEAKIAVKTAPKSTSKAAAKAPAKAVAKTLAKTAAPKKAEKIAKPTAKKAAKAAEKVVPKSAAVVQQLVKLIHKTLDDNKAEDIVLLDLKDKCSFADYMFVASGRAQRHVGALADHVADALKKIGMPPLSIEGKTGCDWVLLDTGDIVVHLFRPEVRQFYNIEKMWALPATPAL